MGEALTKIIMTGIARPFSDACKYCCDDCHCHSESGCKETCPCVCDIETHAHGSEDEEVG